MERNAVKHLIFLRFPSFACSLACHILLRTCSLACHIFMAKYRLARWRAIFWVDLLLGMLYFGRTCSLVCHIWPYSFSVYYPEYFINRSFEHFGVHLVSGQVY